MRFGGITAIEDVSFTVEPGTVHALIGPNGAGKSTTLNVLTGVYAPTAGTVRYGDTQLTGLRPHRIARLQISRTFQNIALSPTSTVQDNLLLGRHRLSKAGFVSTGLGLPARAASRPSRSRRSARSPRCSTSSSHLDRPVAGLQLRRPQARRAGARAVRGAGGAAARRARRGHERRRDRADGADDPRRPLGARHLDRARRARHGLRDGPRRPGDGARLRPLHRRRDARRGAQRPEGRRGLLGAAKPEPTRRTPRR